MLAQEGVVKATNGRYWKKTDHACTRHRHCDSGRDSATRGDAVQGGGGGAAGVGGVVGGDLNQINVLPVIYPWTFGKRVSILS